MKKTLGSVLKLIYYIRRLLRRAMARLKKGRNHYKGPPSKGSRLSQKPEEAAPALPELRKKNTLLVEQNAMLIAQNQVLMGLLERFKEKSNVSGPVDVKELAKEIAKRIHGFDTVLETVSQEDDIFINPLEAVSGLEKSFDTLGEAGTVESGAQSKSSKLKELLGKKKD